MGGLHTTVVAEPIPSSERRALGFLWLLSLSHGIIDLSSGALVSLLPALREHFSLSYTLVGNVMLFSSLTSSFTQPFFGLLSDKAEKRWLVPASLLFAGLGLAAIGFMPSYWLVLVAVVVSALGTAAFHPEGAHAAHNLGGSRQARAMAIYSVGGNAGYALGTVYGAALVAFGGGMSGTAWGFVLPGLLGLVIFRLLPRWQRLEAETVPSKGGRRDAQPATNWRGTITLTLVVIIRSIINLGVVSYLPFYWIDILGNSQETASYVQLTYLFAGVFGTLFGAPLADRIGTKRMLVLSFAVLLPLQFALPYLSGVTLLATLFAAGFVVVSTFTTTLVMTQQYMPRSLGLASGINLGLAFGLGGVGALVLGMIADRWGVVTVLQVTACLGLPALLLSWALPPVSRREPA